MLLGRVAGTLVASRKEGTLEGLKFLVIRTVDVDGEDTGSYVVAADAVVVDTTGRDVAQVLGALLQLVWGSE